MMHLSLRTLSSSKSQSTVNYERIFKIMKVYTYSIAVYCTTALAVGICRVSWAYQAVGFFSTKYMSTKDFVT